jgi:shikimate dehydrogenase
MERIKPSPENKKENLASELWFLREDKELLQKGDIKTTVRLGDRTHKTADSKGGYRMGSFATLKIQKCTTPHVFDDWETKIAITGIFLKKFSDIRDKDLEGSLPGQETKTGLRDKLSRFYNRQIKEDEQMTVINFELAENLKSVKELVGAKILRIAKQPKDNKPEFSAQHLTVPLIEHDYPAMTPAMWNAAYKAFGIKDRNIMLVGDPLGCAEILKIFRRDPKFIGGGMGVGFKDEAVKFVDELDPLAKAIGSINFIRKTPDKKLIGYNTDGLGYAQSLENVFKQNKKEIAGKKAVILGAGGTGNAIAFALAQKGMKIVILNRTIAKAVDLAIRLNNFLHIEGENKVRFGGEDQIAFEIQSADAVINVSTKGASGEMENYNALAPAKLPATNVNIGENEYLAARTIKLIPKNAILSDIVLTKEPTPFLRLAKANGFQTLDGLPMVINQGIEAFWLLYQNVLKEKGISKKDVAKVMNIATG